MVSIHGSWTTTWSGTTCECFNIAAVYILKYISTGLPLGILQWLCTKGSTTPKDFGLNPDYILNHPKALYRENPPNHPNRLLLANTEAVIYPQRRHTPPPPFLIWHKTSFIEENWSLLANVIIRYNIRGTDHGRDARIRTKGNGKGFWMEFKSARHGAPESKWKWKEIKHTELTPLTACHGNKDYPWIIVSGKQDVGRYCKAISCPMLPEDAETSDVWFTVALAQVEMRSAKPVTVLDLPREERQIRQGDLAVVFRTQDERKEELFVYEGVRAMARKNGKSMMWTVNQIVQYRSWYRKTQ
jgi:hypothetical protein